jgi:hypothetical protein
MMGDGMTNMKEKLTGILIIAVVSMLAAVADSMLEEQKTLFIEDNSDK